MVGREHQDHLQELASVGRELPPEPEEGDHTANANLLVKDSPGGGGAEVTIGTENCTAQQQRAKIYYFVFSRSISRSWCT